MSKYNPYKAMDSSDYKEKRIKPASWYEAKSREKLAELILTKNKRLDYLEHRVEELEEYIDDLMEGNP